MTTRGRIRTTTLPILASALLLASGHIWGVTPAESATPPPPPPPVTPRTTATARPAPAKKSTSVAKPAAGTKSTPAPRASAVPKGTPAPATRATLPRQGPFVVLIVIDAARYDEVNLAQLPNLAKLAAAGTQYSQAWVGQLPSVTESSHATIGTGVLPTRHGILGDTWRVPGTEQMSPNLLNSQLTRTGYIGKFIRQMGAPSLAAEIDQRWPGGVVVSLSGHKVYAADAMGAGSADFIAFGAKDARGHFVPAFIPGHEPASSILQSAQLDLPQYPKQPGVEDTWTTTLALKFLFKYHPRLMMINLPEVDVIGHMVGTDGTVMQPLMQNVDQNIGRIVAAYGRAGILPQTTFIVTADHGMVPGLHTVSSEQVKAIITKAGGDPLYVGHGDYCSIFLKNPGSLPKVKAALANANIPDVAAVYARNPNGRYSLASSPARLATPAVEQAQLDLLSTLDVAESPDIVMVYDENTITMTPNYIKIGRKGDHGGATWGAQHIPLILEGPRIKKGYVSSFPARLVDLAPTIEGLMETLPQKQDGVPLADAITNPLSSAVSAQNRAAPRLTADVTALEQEAALRPNPTGAR